LQTQNPNAIAKPLIQQPLQASNDQEQQSPPVADQSPPAPASVSAPVAASQDAADIAAKLPMPIIVKEEPKEVVIEEAVPNDDLPVDVSEENGSGAGTGTVSGSGSGSGMGGKIPFKKIFQKRKKSSGKRTKPIS